jgi:hypothetical protein
LDENYRPDIRPRLRLPRGCGFTRGRVFTVPGHATSVRARVPADAPPRPRGREKKIKIKNKKYFKKKYFSSLLPAWKEIQFSVFGFQSPKSPNSPSSAGEAARRRIFFRPSSPNHPSKLYSSLGWLNSKVPKPFPPFSLRLIDVDGF